MVPRKLLPAHIADVAVDVFYERGVSGVGMEEVAGRAQVSKRTLYRHFPDRLSLVESGLRARSDRWFARLSSETDPLSLFDLLTEDAQEGCVFVNAHAAGMDSVARWHKSRLLELVRSVVAGAGCSGPDRLARQIMLLVEGAIATAAVSGSSEPVSVARDLVAQLIAEE